MLWSRLFQVLKAIDVMNHLSLQSVASPTAQTKNTTVIGTPQLAIVHVYGKEKTSSAQ
jgi:hypothetical protein